MSSKKQTTGTKKDGKPALVPKLRFPEFRRTEGWCLSRLDSLCERIMDGTHFSPKSTEGPRPYLTSKNIRNGHLDLSTVSYISEDEHRAIYARCPVKQNDVLLTKDGANTGNCAINCLDYEFSLLSSVAVLRANQGLIDPAFLFQSISSDRTKKLIEDSMAGQAITRVTLEKISGFAIPVGNVTEQQKIAECLSSVDEVIAAQALKVGVLKTHKKWLMQQLFPREGETQPRLRFPEFRNAGEWRGETLRSLCARIMDGTHFSPKSKEGPRPYLTSKNIKDGRIDLSNLSYISEEEHAEIYSKCPVKHRDVLITKDGANTGNCALNNLDFEFSLLSSVAVLRGHENKLCQEFLFQSIISDSIQSLITESMSGQAITRITLAKIGGFTISVTSPAEQHRIASCLSSLDDLIAAETQKHEALKRHKRGLMQQLFPSVGGVAGEA